MAPNAKRSTRIFGPPGTRIHGDVQKECDGERPIRHTGPMQSAAIRKWLLATILLAVILWTIVHFYNENAFRSGNITRIILEPQGAFSYHEPKTPASKTNRPPAATASQP